MAMNIGAYAFFRLRKAQQNMPKHGPDRARKICGNQAGNSTRPSMNN